MTRRHARAAGISLSARLYEVLLILYPSSFRRQYGREMVQVFQVACRSAALSGFRGRLHFWVRTFTDLAISAAAERRSDHRSRHGPYRPYAYVGALLVSLLTGYIHLTADADALTMTLLLGGACAFGLASPGRAWRWALIIGLGIPAALLVSHGAIPPPNPHRDADLPLPAPLIPAFIGAYTGALMHRLFPRLTASSRFGRQQF